MHLQSIAISDTSRDHTHSQIFTYPFNLLTLVISVARSTMNLPTQNAVCCPIGKEHTATRQTLETPMFEGSPAHSPGSMNPPSLLETLLNSSSISTNRGSSKNNRPLCSICNSLSAGIASHTGGHFAARKTKIEVRVLLLRGMAPGLLFPVGKTRHPPQEFGAVQCRFDQSSGRPVS